MNDALALLAVTTTLRVFLPDLRTVTRLPLRAAVRAGVGELLQVRPTDTLPSTSEASQGTEEA
ncbi:hypothetical protein GCM10023084_79700 [Streptomyces lacrimifluminis]|uniref:Uncharacterized protein n=1 Tax=Streptomyces lacrimifluminis TaxID=1500077 RepID=A0A917UN61_9ACTN|nr:hypothetical protein [Streptomyces lacrimifluminis]GGJ69215.1 hypothetical protein GCM10012282_77770 [Streptomyces lacrimifluminis]